MGLHNAAFAEGTGPDMSNTEAVWDHCMQENIKTEVWHNKLSPEQAVVSSYRICRPEFKALLSSLPSEEARTNFRAKVKENHGDLLAFGDDIEDMGDPMAVPGDDTETGPAITAPAKQISTADDANIGKLDFKGIGIGEITTPEAVGEKIGVGCGLGSGNMQVCNGSTTIAGVPASINLVIGNDGRVLRMLLTFQSQGFEIVETAMLKKFGKPSVIENSIVQNGLGAQFQQRDVIWNKGTNALSLSRFAGNVTEGMAYYSA